MQGRCYLCSAIFRLKRSLPPRQAPPSDFGVLETQDGQDREVMVLPEISSDFHFVLRLAHVLTMKQFQPQDLLHLLARLP